LKKLDEAVKGGIKSLENRLATQKRIDHMSIRNVKSRIRSCEAKIAVDEFGIHEKFTHDLNLPFYNNKKSTTPITEKDYQIVRNLLRLT
jgi:hypothetical protein